MSRWTNPQLPREGFTDHVFAVKHGVELSLRIWRAKNPNSGAAPWIFWSHGGAFAGLTHYRTPPWTFPAFVDRGYHLVSWSYRLLPQAGIPEIVEDGQDAMVWCKANLPSILGADAIDIDRYFTGGESAGGTICTIMATVLDPPPRAVVGIYGAYDLLDPVMYNDKPISYGPLSGRYTEAEIETAIKDRDLSNALVGCPELFDRNQDDAGIAETIKVWSKAAAVDFPWTKRHLLQADIKAYIQGNGTAMSLLTRKAEYKDERVWKESTMALSPIGRVRKAGEFPPIFFLSGEADRVVPPSSQGKPFAEELRKMGVPVEEAYEPDMDHGFDNKYTDASVPGWETYILPIMKFIDLHLDMVRE